MEEIRSPVPQPMSRIRVAEENGTVSFAADTIALAPWTEGLSLGNCLLQAAPQIDHTSGGASNGIAVLGSGVGAASDYISAVFLLTSYCARLLKLGLLEILKYLMFCH